MTFRFAGEKLNGSEIGYITSKNQFFDFLNGNRNEIEEIITDKLEDNEIYQWDELDIDLRVANNSKEDAKHILLVGDSFIPEESFEDDILIRTIKATIFCITESHIECVSS